MITDQQVTEMVRAMGSIAWAVRPQKIRDLPEIEQLAWFNRIMLEIQTGERR